MYDMTTNLARKNLGKFAGILAGVVSLWLATESQADIKLPVIFTQNMVLQQGMPVPVWGWADEGESVTVQFQGQRVTTTAKDGKWMVKLKPLKASADPDSLICDGRNRVKLDNVLVGEVWICSGQSNMEFHMTSAFQGETDIKTSANPNIRLFTVVKARSEEPYDDLKQAWNVGKFAWQECDAQSTPDFSAVAYYFGRALQKARNVPVGLIHTSWGGSPAEVWMSQQALEATPVYKSEILDPFPAQLEQFKIKKAKYDADLAAAKKAGTKFTERAPNLWRPTELYNAMIHPLIPFAIKGAIWYQGESNAGRAYQYRSLFVDMIKNWRKDWGQGDFAFMAVQLAPFKKIKDQPADSDWAELREAQLLATTKLRNVGMAVITDVGEENDIHPKKKGPVGERLALAARGVAYGEKIEFSGPVFKNLKVKKNEAILTFDHVGSGLEAKDGELKGFAIAGADKKFVWAKAEIQPNNTIVLTAPGVDKPVAVRFGWADYPVVNLWNKDGLPATPFRTDDFQMITGPKEVKK